MVFLCIILFISGTTAFCQEKPVTYEQSALDFYETKILSLNPPPEKLKYSDDPAPWRLILKDKKCLMELGIDSLKRDTIQSGISGWQHPHGENFVKKKFLMSRYPDVLVSPSFSNKKNQHIVTVTELYKDKAIFYHIDVSDDRVVTNWCTSQINRKP
jgi:hypothetical protein